MPHDIYNVFPEILENKDYKYWNTIDFNNMKNLDDTNVLKCSKIVSELKSQSNKWKLLFESNERNGTIGFELI
jgi:hypothetical protein